VSALACGLGEDPVQQNERRAADVVRGDGCEDNRLPNIGSRRVDEPHEAKTLDDAAVSDLLEGIAKKEPTTQLLSNKGIADIQALGGEVTSVATKRPILALALTAVALAVITIIGFVCVAARAPGMASVLLCLVIVLTPFAAASALREEVMPNEGQNAGTQGSPEHTNED
jgi:hypothetical protein